MGGVVLLSYASCLAWDVLHWSLLAVGWSWVLALRWRYLVELLTIDIMWGREVSGGLQPHSSEEKGEKKKENKNKNKIK